MLLNRKLAKCSSEAALAALVIVVAIAASGCVHYHHRHHRHGGPVVVHAPGPPPHAPAHGHRHRHDSGVELVFDAGLGVYAVADLPGHFWYADRYLRWNEGRWYASARLDGVWVVIGGNDVPVKLKSKYASRGKKKHGHSWPAKHRH